MTGRRSTWRKYLQAGGIALGLLLLAQQAWQGYVALQQAQACVVRPRFLIMALGLYVVAYFVQMAAWAMIMRYLHAPLPPRAVVEGYAISFLPRYIPGSVWGYLSRNEWLAQTHAVSYSISTTASLVEAAMLLVTAGVLGGLYWLPAHYDLSILAIAGLGILAAWLTWRIVPWLVIKINIGGRRIEIDLAQEHRMRLWSATTALYVGFWVLQGAALLLIARTLCGNLVLDIVPATASFALAWAIGFLIIFVPAGLGVREWTLSALLVAFATLQPGQSTLIALISRLGLIGAELLILLIGFHGKIQKRKIQNGQIQSWGRKRDWSANDGSLE